MGLIEDRPVSLPEGPASCWSCRKEISTQDPYCKHCGKGQGAQIPWYYRHWGIIVLTLVALGPFSLFLVWRSPLLSRRSQWIYTAAIGAFTYYTCLTAYHIWVAVYNLSNSFLKGGLIP